MGLPRANTAREGETMTTFWAGGWSGVRPLLSGFLLVPTLQTKAGGPGKAGGGLA
jgi:hypothetical protein